MKVFLGLLIVIPSLLGTSVPEQQPSLTPIKVILARKQHASCEETDTAQALARVCILSDAHAFVPLKNNVSSLANAHM